MRMSIYKILSWILFVISILFAAAGLIVIFGTPAPGEDPPTTLIISGFASSFLLAIFWRWAADVLDAIREE